MNEAEKLIKEFEKKKANFGRPSNILWITNLLNKALNLLKELGVMNEFAKSLDSLEYRVLEDLKEFLGISLKIKDILEK